MNQEIKDKWLKALEVAPQTTGTLKDSTGFCCLGVLCQVYMDEQKVGSWDNYCGTNYQFELPNGDSFTEFLPDQVQEWAGLKNEDPFVPLTSAASCSFGQYEAQEIDGVECVHISMINDNSLPFSEIAEIIKKHL